MYIGARKVVYGLLDLLPLRHRLNHESNQFDRDFGVVTAPPVPLDELEAFEHAAFACSYQATPPDAMGKMMEALPINLDEYSFIDMGSGMGRALLLAAAYPFREILGIEFSAQLHQQACRNIVSAQTAGRIGQNVASVNIDASRYEFPHGNLVLYLFNPFQEPIIQTVLENMKRALDRQPREIFVVYCHPKYPQPFDSSPFLQKIHHSPSSPGVFGFSVYAGSSN